MGLDHSRVDYACDVVLYTEFESQEALDAYATHPAHLRVKGELGQMRIARFQVDYAVTAGALRSRHEGTALMKDFVYTALPSRVVFGAGKLASIREEVEAIGSTRALVLCTPPQRAQAEKVGELLGSSLAGIHDGAEMHVPIESARKARELAAELGADCAVAIGGGSTIGLGKAIALEAPIPIIAIPTTYAGSEMTPIYGITEGGLKRTGKDVARPAALRGLRPRPDDDPAARHVARQRHERHRPRGRGALRPGRQPGDVADGGGGHPRPGARACRALAEAPDDKEARALCLYGAWLCGTVLGNVGMALHHKLCHTLGGSFNLPHAETHTVVLPHALAYNARRRPRRWRGSRGDRRLRRARRPAPDGGEARDAHGAARPRPEGSRPRPRLRDRARQPLLEPAADRGRAAARPAPARLGGRGAAALTRMICKAAAAIRSAHAIARR